VKALDYPLRTVTVAKRPYKISATILYAPDNTPVRLILKATDKGVTRELIHINMDENPSPEGDITANLILRGIGIDHTTARVENGQFLIV